MNSLHTGRSLRLACLLPVAALIATSLLPTAATAQSTTPPIACDETTGMAGPFACDSVDLLAIVPSGELSLTYCGIPEGTDLTEPFPMTGSDMWGWTHTDAQGSVREFAVQGQSNGTAFIEVTDPAMPVFLGCMEAPAPNFLWRDVKVYGDHAYVVGDFSPEAADLFEEGHDHDHGHPPPATGQHGLQIFDLTQLLNAGPMPQKFTNYHVYLGFDEAHNLVVNEATGLMAAVASDTCGAEWHLVDLSADPTQPVQVGCYDSGLPGAVHDAQCTIYHGPDVEHQGKEICLGFMEDQFAIFDMSNPGAPVILASNLTYEGQGYVHQGWFTEDHAYVASNDELDELNSITAAAQHNTRTYMWDVRDLDNPTFIGTYEAATAAIDHNMYFKGRYLHQANYTAGYRVLDAVDIGTGLLEQVAFFDTHPPDDSDGPTFAGVWSGYFHFESGAVALSQIDSGQLFVLQPDLPAEPPVDDDDFDSDGKRDDADSDDDNDGDSDGSDNDDDNDGDSDDSDSDDDNDGIRDDYDSQSDRDEYNERNELAAANGINESSLSVDAGTLLLIAAAESAAAEALTVEIYGPSGTLVATSTSALGRALATAIPAMPGSYKVRVINESEDPVLYRLVTVERRVW